MFDISSIIAIVALLISVIGWLYEANARRQLQKWVRKSMIVGSRLNVVDDYVIEAGKLAEKIQEILSLKLKARKMGLLRRAGNDISQTRVWLAARRHNNNLSKLELNVADILEIIDDPGLDLHKVQLQTATKKLYDAIKNLRDSDLQKHEIDAAIENSQEMLNEIKVARVAFRREIDATLLNW